MPKRTAQPFARITSLFRDGNEERHAALLRSLITVTALGWFLTQWVGDQGGGVVAPALALGYLAYSIALFVWITVRPTPSPLRRALAITTDTTIVSGAMVVAGGLATFLYPVYPWITVGAGMRYGLRYLFYAMGLSVVGFGIVISLTDYWIDKRTLAYGLLIGIIILPMFYYVLIRRLHNANNQLSRQMRETEHTATHDELTGLPNRVLFHRSLDEHLASARRTGSTLAVMFLDLDRFKYINDTIGHAAGDELLHHVAQRLIGCIRNGDTLARLGGDEFTVLLPDLESSHDAETVATKIIAAVAKPYYLHGFEIHLDITVSVGLSLFPAHGDDVQELLKNADIAMYAAKRTGRNAYRVYDPGMRFSSIRLLNLERELRRAVDHGQFELHYQPCVSLPDQHVIGVEALLRWRRPHSGLTLPNEFLPLAEETGLIFPIGEWVLKTALTTMNRWRDNGLRGIFVSINVSPTQLSNRAFLRLLRDCTSELAEGELDFMIEITERGHLRGRDGIESVLHELRGTGALVAVDDFGTGYSSLGYIKDYPVDVLKIDGGFVDRLATDTRHRTMLEAITRIAGAFEMRTIAECVEGTAQARILAGCGCDAAQGHLFGRPQSEVELWPRLIGDRLAGPDAADDMGGSPAPEPTGP